MNYIERMKKQLEDKNIRKKSIEMYIKIHRSKRIEALFEIRNEAQELAEGKKSKVKLKRLLDNEYVIAQKINDLEFDLKLINDEIEDIEYELNNE